MLVVGEPRSEAEAVSSLGFSHVASAGDPLWLVVGHASGAVVVWDLSRRPARQAVAIGGCTMGPFGGSGCMDFSASVLLLCLCLLAGSMLHVL